MLGSSTQSGVRNVVAMRLSNNTLQLLLICSCVLLVIWILHHMTLPLEDVIPMQIVTPSPVPFAQELPWETEPEEIFSQGMFEYNTSRIPALIYHKDTFFAFCEGRKDTNRDIGRMEILLRRGHLDGTNVKWGPLQVVASKYGFRVMNPCAVVENELDIILLVFIAIPTWVDQRDLWITGKYNQQVLLVRSFDNGETWTMPADITESTIGKIKPMISIYAPGPGHGIQLKTGRIIIPGNYLVQDEKALSTQETSFFNNSGHANVIWSDDKGFTWHLGGSLDQSNMEVIANEAIAVELDHGHICMNSRTLEFDKPRVLTFSWDEGNTFGKGYFAEELVEPGYRKNENGTVEPKSSGSGCQGSMIGFPAPHHHLTPFSSSKTWVLFSNPASRMLRVNLAIRLSQDGCNSWSKPWLIHNNVSSYSDLTYVERYQSYPSDLSGGSPKVARTQAFAVLYEGGFENYWDSIYFKMFNIEAVLNGVQNTKYVVPDVPEEYKLVKSKDDTDIMPDVG